MKVGIVPMSAKPYHAGHDGLVRIAARENDVVHLYVSTSDRDAVSGQAMLAIWKDQIEPSLPKNVEVEYGGSPVGKAYKELGDADAAGSKDEFVLYSDVTDAATNFAPAALAKYAPNLHAGGRITVRGVERSSTVDVSGTKMRQFIADGDKDSFLRYMPKAIDGVKVWNTLVSMKPEVKKTVKRAAKSPKNESLLRLYVHHTLPRR